MRTLVLVDNVIAADNAVHDIDLPTGTPPVDSILYARQIDNGAPAEVDLTVKASKAAIDGNDQIAKLDADTISARVATAVAVDDFLVLNITEVGERVLTS